MNTDPESSTIGVTLPSIVVVACTYQRNDPLRTLLTAVRVNADLLAGIAQVGVVIVDDNVDQRARAVCDEFTDSFALGLHYCTSGLGNISIGRNIGLEAALPISDWIAMTDDDCEPVDDWLATYLTMQRQTGVDALTGPCLLEVPVDAPSWLTDQPFHEDGQFRWDDGATMTVAATNNSFFRSEFFRQRPKLRFEPELGIVGGEDMVFFRSAVRHGLTIRFAANAIVRGHEPAERQSFRYQVRSKFWLGNTEFVTNRFLGEASRGRWILRSLKLFVLAAVRPFQRLVTGKTPQWRYAYAQMARALGVLTGSLGIRLRHH